MSDQKSSTNTWSFLAGAVIGSAVGAGVALLFAPASGKETRKKIKQQGEKLYKDIRKKVEPTIKGFEKGIREGKRGLAAKLEE